MKKEITYLLHVYVHPTHYVAEALYTKLLSVGHMFRLVTTQTQKLGKFEAQFIY